MALKFRLLYFYINFNSKVVKPLKADEPSLSISGFSEKEYIQKINNISFLTDLFINFMFKIKKYIRTETAIIQLHMK
jgi:hypothetical protein